jgi:hypothetical protein
VPRVSSAFGQSTTLIYQGKLTGASNPANGDSDQFKLFYTVTI